MPRNMSFMLTVEQMRAQTKTVTRRLGWRTLEPGTVLNACVKCMGLRKGERVQKLGQIRVKRVSIAPLAASMRHFPGDAAREGYPELTDEEFVELFCRHMGVTSDEPVTRIEFEHVTVDRTGSPETAS